MANVTLSYAEMKLVTNASFILTKNSIINKVYALFGELSNTFKNIATQQYLPEEVLYTSPKIYRGENYEGLPWVMLDYPRYFKNEDFFAIRVFFWWGNFFSITLQLKGKYKTIFQNSFSNIANDDWFLCLNENEWQHHFREDNYKPLALVSEIELNNLSFIKLAKKIPLTEWNNAEDFFLIYFKQLVKLTSQSVK